MSIRDTIIPTPIVMPKYIPLETRLCTDAYDAKTDWVIWLGRQQEIGAAHYLYLMTEFGSELDLADRKVWLAFERDKIIGQAFQTVYPREPGAYTLHLYADYHSRASVNVVPDLRDDIYNLSLRKIWSVVGRKF